MGPTSVLPLDSLHQSGQSRAWHLPQQMTGVCEVKLLLLGYKCTIHATAHLPELNCTS